MRLVFPNGEHGQVLLAPGLNRIGSADSASIVLKWPGVAAFHCDINVSASGASLVPSPNNPVEVNERPVRELIALRSGDVIGLAGVRARVVSLREASGEALDKSTDSDVTRIRPAVPKLVLRGVTAPVFGKVFPVTGPMTIGRAPECDLSLDSEQVSRKHVRLTPREGSVLVEDLGSSNGTWVGGKRVDSAVLQPGQELRLDAVRFLLLEPGKPIPPPSRRLGGLLPAQRNRWLAISVVVVALVVIGGLVAGRLL